jgi:outer membrane protein
MKIKVLMALVAAVIVSVNTSFAQVKIGHTNIELILAYMPETEQMNKDLQIYAKKLDKELQVEENYFQLKMDEYTNLSKQNKLTPADDENRQIELMKLDSSLRRKQAVQEQQLMAMQQELIGPSLDKLQKAIDDISTEEGYTYILNQSTTSGVSTILRAPDSDNITEKIFAKLGIEMPKELKGEAPAPPKQ